MAMSLRSGLTPASRSKQDLIADKDRIDAELAAREAGELLERRKVLAAELATCTLPHDNTANELGKLIAKLEGELADARTKLSIFNHTRGMQGIQNRERQLALTTELAATAAPEITAAEKSLQKKIDSLPQSTHQVLGDGFGHDRKYFTNVVAIGEYRMAANSALNSLADLRMKALDPKEVAKAISKIMSGIPAESFEIKEVVK